MAQKEHFYTAESFQLAGINPFREHVKQYLDGQRTVPISKTQSHNTHDVFFTFSNPLLQRFFEQPNSIKKPYESALKYGFKGYSLGGRNGIFLLRDGDRGLIEAIDRLALTHEDTVREDLDLRENGLDVLRKVKIVWHERSGKRVVGVYNTDNSRILFLNFVQY